MKSLVKPLLSMALSGAALLAGFSAQAQELKIGYVSLSKPQCLSMR